MPYYSQGRYNTIVREQGFTESKNGNVGFWVKVDVTDSIAADGAVEPTPAAWERTAKLWFSEKSKDRSLEILEGLGFTTGDFRDLEPGGSFSFVGKSIELRCLHEEWEGKQIEKWEFPFAGSSWTPEATVNAGRHLNALFGADLKKKAAPAKPAEPINTGTGEATGDDVPF